MEVKKNKENDKNVFSKLRSGLGLVEAETQIQTEAQTQTQTQTERLGRAAGLGTEDSGLGSGVWGHGVYGDWGLWMIHEQCPKREEINSEEIPSASGTFMLE